MKIAVFYENIYDGAKAKGLEMEDLLRGFKGEGMDLIYISADSLRRDREWLLPLLKKLDIGIEGVHAFCDFGKDPDKPLGRDIIDLAAECGAGNLLFVPGMYSGKSTIECVNNMVKGLTSAVNYAKGQGLPVLIEDFDSTASPYNSMLMLDWFFNKVEGLGCAFDTGNFVIYHEDELEAFERFKHNIVTVHLKDRVTEKRHPGDSSYLCADKQTVHSCQIGIGFIHIEEILQRLKGMGYGGNVIAEVYGCDHDYILDDIHGSLGFLRDKV
ncbi:MAG: TIM barrel protein [Clostridia bacterium]|nr:TIM barrel protein [Clostridia bacterium]